MLRPLDRSMMPVETLTRNLNEDLWDSVGFIHDENVKTMDFFDVYTEYFG